MHYNVPHTHYSNQILTLKYQVSLVLNIISNLMSLNINIPMTVHLQIPYTSFSRLRTPPIINFTPNIRQPSGLPLSVQIYLNSDCRFICYIKNYSILQIIFQIISIIMQTATLQKQKVKSNEVIFSRLDNVMKQIDRLNNIIAIDDKFNYLYIKKVLQDSISEDNSEKESFIDPVVETLENKKDINKRKVQKNSQKNRSLEKIKYKETEKIQEGPENALSLKKNINPESNKIMPRMKTEQRSKNNKVISEKNLKSIKVISHKKSSNKSTQPAISFKSKNKNTSRGINTSSNSQQSYSNSKKTLKRPESLKWLNSSCQKPLLKTVMLQKSQRGLKLSKMNLNKYKQNVKKVEIGLKSSNYLQQKYHINLNHTHPQMSKLIEKLNNAEVYQQETSKYLNTISQLTEQVVFRELGSNFNANSDLLKILMIFISQFSSKVKRQLTDAFTKSDMKFDALVRSSIKAISQLPSLLFKNNEVSEVKFIEFMKQTECIQCSSSSNMINSIVAIRDYLRFLYKNHLVSFTEKSQIYTSRKDVEFNSHRNKTHRQNLECVRRRQLKKCQTDRKPFTQKQNKGFQRINQNKTGNTRYIKSQQRLPKTFKTRHSFDALSKQSIT